MEHVVAISHAALQMSWAPLLNLLLKGCTGESTLAPASGQNSSSSSVVSGSVGMRHGICDTVASISAILHACSASVADTPRGRKVGVGGQDNKEHRRKEESKACGHRNKQMPWRAKNIALAVNVL